MPINFDRLIGEVRTDLLNPDDYGPSDDFILQKAGDVIQNRHMEQQNTGVGWSMGSYDIRTQAGLPSYTVGLDAQFGKPVRIHTIDPSDPYHVTRKVDIVDRQQVDNYYQGSDRAFVGAEHHTAVLAVVEWQAGQPRITFIPTPNGAASYRVWYDVGEVADPTLGAILPVSPPLHRYIRISTSSACVPAASWQRLLGSNAAKMEPERKMALMERQQGVIMGGLVRQEAQFAAAYEDYIQTSFQPGTGSPHGYADYAEDGYC